MSLYVTSLNSGSNGNCYYVGNNEEAVLIDAGISCREIEKRMNMLKLSMQNVKAVFISHEHSDHIRGITVLSRKYKLPVYITNATLKNSSLKFNAETVLSFTENTAVEIGTLKITAFTKHHDAADPYSFVVEHNSVRVGVFTDIGKPCSQLIHHFTQCQAVFLESNYDEKMLEDGNYPYHLKRRISGGKGHLSNKQALELFTCHRSADLSHLILSHLSKNNNCPDLVYELFSNHTVNTQIIVASRYEASALYYIPGVVTDRITPIAESRFAQMSLF